MQIVRILAHQTFEERGNDVERADTVDELRIEVLHFLAVALVQNLKAIAFLDVGFDAVTLRSEAKAKRATD